MADDALPCPGQPSRVRPARAVPVCQACPLWRRGAEFEDRYQKPVARHDGERWRCERGEALMRPAGPDADEPEGA